MSKLKERLSDERTAAGLSQQQLADKAKCSQATVADIERGRNQDSIKLPQIAAALGLHVLWLKDGKGPKYLDADQTIEGGLYITDPRIVAIARRLMDAKSSGDDYLVDKTQKSLDEDAELIAQATARARNNDRRNN